MKIEPKVEVRTTKRTTIEINEDQAAVLLKEAVGAPARAEVEFDCGYEILRQVNITWKEES